METINSIINFLPTGWKAPLMVGFAVLTIGGRIYHALKNGGGIKGIWNSVVLGANQTKPTEETK